MQEATPIWVTKVQLLPVKFPMLRCASDGAGQGFLLWVQ